MIQLHMVRNMSHSSDPKSIMDMIVEAAIYMLTNTLYNTITQDGKQSDFLGKKSFLQTSAKSKYLHLNSDANSILMSTLAL